MPPNLQQLHGSYIVTDQTGCLMEEATQKIIKENGYNIKVLDLTNPELSTWYNPFDNLHAKEDVWSQISSLIEGASPNHKSNNRGGL